VNIHSGTYTEGPQVLADKNVNLIGDGKTTTIINPTANTGISGDAKAWWLVGDGKTFNMQKVTLDGSGKLIWIAIRHKGNGTLLDCAFANIQYDAGGGAGHAYQGTAIGVHTSGNVDVTDCTFSGIGRVGIAAYDEFDPLPVTGPTGTYSGNTYVGKGAGDWLDYAFQVQAGANITITNNNASACLGVAYDGSGSSAVAVWDDPSTRAVISNNSFLNNSAGVAVGVAWASSSDPVMHIEGNTATGGEIGLELLGGIALVQSNILTGNTVAAIRVENDATVDAGDLLGRNITGLGTSTGGNLLTGYGVNEAAPWAIDASGTVTGAQVLAYANDFGAVATDDINKLITDGFDGSGPVLVEFSQAGPLTAIAPTAVTVQCGAGIPTPVTTLANFIAIGGVVSASPVTITSVDTNYLGFPVGDGTVIRAYTLTDAYSRTVLVNQTITVDDTNAPTIICPANVVVSNDVGQCYASGVALGTPTTGDNCGVALVVSNAPIQFPIGNTTVMWTVTDNSGLTNTCNQIVTVIDQQAPAINALTATQTGNVLNCAGVVLQGTVNIAVQATDQCPLAPPVITLTNGVTGELATYTGSSGGFYNYTWGVSNLTLNGTWTATVAASDANNVTTTNFTLCVNKTQITGQIALQGFTGVGPTYTNQTRLVTFKATTNSPTATNVVATWNIALTFANSVGGTNYASYTLTGVPDGVTALSAKTAWNLRRRIPLTLDVDNQAVVNFTGMNIVRGGDIAPTTRDNAVQLLDYISLVTYWYSTNAVADIDGNGQVNSLDYEILSLNWYTGGDAE
jgi:hypothetical protein